MSPEEPGWILGHFYSQDIRIIIQKTESTESIFEQQTKNGSLESYKERELSRQTILKSSLSIEIILILFISYFFWNKRQCHFSVAQVIFVKRSVGHACVDVTKWFEHLTRFACARQQYKKYSLDFCYKEIGRLFVYTILHMKNFKKQFIERNCHCRRKRRQEMNGHWRDVHSLNLFVCHFSLNQAIWLRQ